MVYHLSVEEKRPFNAAELMVIWAILGVVSGILFVIVGGIFDLLGPLAWAAKGVIAYGFVMLFGKLVDSYYRTENAKLAR